MGSYYVNDPESEFGLKPVPEDEYAQAIFCIANKRGLRITDELILKELGRSSENLDNNKQK